MGKETNIAWTDSTFNPWIGCTNVSPGCNNCYAEVLDHRFGGNHWGKGAPRRVTGEAYWKQPLHWNKQAREANEVTRVFCGSQCDVMDDEAPAGMRERLWDLIDQTPYLTWLLLTKRPHRYNRYLPNRFQQDNLILGTTSENQEFYNVRWPHLRIAAHDYGLRSFISYEPAIGPLSMKDWVYSPENNTTDDARDYPDWLIFGGETGVGRRPVNMKWAKDIKGECEDNGVAFFMKQMSARTPDEAASLIPVDMLVRNFPA